MADKTLTVNGQPFTFNRDRFAGVRTMTATTPLSDGTTEMQVTVTGTDSNGNDNSSLSGTYTRANSTATSWSQVGGNGNIYLLSGSWNFIDGSDGTPNFTVTGSDKVPWQVASSFASNNVTLSSAEETVTVDRTASVIDSDRAGESRPLLSKVVGGAAVAYSLRDLNDKQGNNKVVRVRRESDNTERDFLAKEISNGTLEAFVNTPSNGVFQNSGYESFSNASASGFTASNTGSTGFAVAPISGISGNKVSVSFDINITNGSPKLTLRTELSFGLNASTHLEYTTSGSYTATLTAYSTFVGIGFTEGDVPSNFTVSNFKIIGNGFVETWYDQSGNGSDATQTTIAKQPKIVDGGSLVTGGIDFLNGTSTGLETNNSDICNVPQLSIFTVLTPHTAASQTQAFSCGSVISGSTGYGGWKLNFNGYSDDVQLQTQIKGNTSSTSLTADVTSSECLVAYVAAFPNATGSVNGGTAVTRSDMISPNQTGVITRKFRIGGQFTFNFAANYTKPINEIIIYTTDQSANRPAIEANIKNQYNLT